MRTVQEKATQLGTPIALKVGTPVSVVIYGVLRTGVVEILGNYSGVVFVRMDHSKKLRWFLPQSLTVLNREGVS